MRLFVALDPPEPVRTALDRQILAIRPELAAAAGAAEPNNHRAMGDRR